MSESTYRTFVSTSIGSFVSDRRKEIGYMSGILLGLFALVSMVGWRADDPNLLRESTSDLMNPCGPIGANLAEFLFALFGVGAWGVAFGVAALVLALAGRTLMSAWQWMSVVVLGVLSLSFVQLVFESTDPHPIGGAVGYWGLHVFVLGLGRVGAGLVLVGLGLLCVTFSAKIQWTRIAHVFVGRLEHWLPIVRDLLVRASWWTLRTFGKSGGWAARWVRRHAGRSAVRIKFAVRRMWMSVTRGEDSTSFDTTWAEEVWETDISRPFEPEGNQPELSVVEDSGDTVVKDESVAVVEAQWEGTAPSQDANPGTSRGNLLEMFPDFAPRKTVVQNEPPVMGTEPAVEEKRTSHYEELDGVTSESVVEPYGLSQPPSNIAPNVEDKQSKVLPKEAVAVSSSVSLEPNVEVSASKYLDAKVSDDGKSVRNLGKKEPWNLPPLSLLDIVPEQNSSFDTENLREKARVLEEKLHSFNVRGQVTGIRPGPVVTIFEFLPEAGIKVSKIAGLSDDLAMALKAIRVRIVAPIPGRGVLGIEIPSARRLTIYLREVLASPEFRDSEAILPCVLGKDVEGKPVVADLSKMPHLLVGGTTGSGKSVGVNGMLMSMLFTRSPDELRLLLIDPKMLEFELYGDIPHLLHPVVTDPKIAAQALSWACREMDQRYELLARWGTRNILSYNKKVVKELATWNDEKARKYAPKNAAEHEFVRPEKLPFIVIIIDELADLMMIASKDVESSICRIAQKARACGIHLIVATQRPSVDVVTGLIKANLPSRIAFQLRSRHDSRTVLDEIGAENLLGRGDMLYLPPGVGGLQRCHGAFVADDEVSRVTEYLREQCDPDFISVVDLNEGNASDDFSEDQDELYEDACRVVIKAGKASTSMVQRYFKIGYNRAARIVDQMEARGVIGPPDGARPREVLMAAAN